MNNNRIKNQGFTLIELLVVISVIGILSSVVLANVNSAREKARLAVATAFEANIHRAYGANAIGIWNFDEGSGVSVADTSGRNYSGSLTGSPLPGWVAGINGTALDFTSTNYVQLPDLRNRMDLVGGSPGGKIMICAWIKPTQYIASRYSIFASGFPGLLYFGISPNRNLILMVNAPGQGNGNYWPSSLATITLNKWTHVCFLLEDGIGYQFYIDGKLDRTVSQPLIKIINMGGAQTAIGRSYFDDPAGGDFIGYIDTVRVYYANI
ncbi:MAG: LamG-like jellyroll fold domain-containing protein [Candidatus Paceibacterota bacterium]|jgi:prepilin-type N-terminal cleavage/methylation domain-containing protein